MADGNPRVRAVDVLRGLTVLGIIAIHARISVDWFGHRHLIDRSVPCFLVLMGVSSELWRRQHAPKAKLAHIKAYLVATARRLVLPYWAWLLLLLPIALAAGNGPERASLWLLAPLGYVPWAGPAWLITAVALLSVAVPVLQLLITRLGPLPTAAIALAITVWSHLHAFAIIGVLRVGLPLPEGKPALFLFWIFAPAYLWHVAAGLCDAVAPSASVATL